MGKSRDTTSVNQSTNQQQQQVNFGDFSSLAQQLARSVQNYQSQNSSAQNQQQSGATHENMSQTSTTSMPSYQQAAARDYFSTLGRMQDKNGLQQAVYGGDRVADLTPAQQQGFTSALNYANSPGLRNYIGSAIAGNEHLLSPDMMDPSKVPGFAASQADVARQVTENLTRNILPASRAGSIINGAYGGSTQANADALLKAQASKDLAGTLANMNVNQSNIGLNAMLQAISQAPMVASLGLVPSQIQQQVGTAQQGQNQAEINANMAKFGEEQVAPLQALQLYKQLVGQQGEYGGTTSAQGNTGQVFNNYGNTTGYNTSQGSQTNFSQQNNTNQGTTANAAAGSMIGNTRGTQTTDHDAGFMQTLGSLGSLAMMALMFM